MINGSSFIKFIELPFITFNRLVGVVFGDASLGNVATCEEDKKKLSSQLAYVGCRADEAILKDQEAACSILVWKSHKMQSRGKCLVHRG